MTKPTELTPEIILAVFEHRTRREEEIKEAIKACSPNEFISPFVHSSVLLSGGIRLEVRSDIVRDRMTRQWGTRREGLDFDALCDQVLADIQAYKDDMFGTDVERLALSIIQIKHNEGVVTDRALRLAGYTQECITAIHERASLLANEMSDGKPFEVEFTDASNEEAA